MGGKIQTSLKLRSRQNASQKMSLRVKQIGFSNAPFPGQAWGTNLVLLPYAGGQPNTTPAVI